MKYLLAMPKNAAKAPGGYNVFPVGIAYVSASLKRSGAEVVTTNLEFDSRTTLAALSAQLADPEIGAICTSGLSRDYGKLGEVLNAARTIRPEILSVVGGGIMSSAPEVAMHALEVDIGVIGEGEQTMCELASALDRRKPFFDVPGLIYRGDGGRLVRSEPRKEIDNLDEIQMPDYDGFSFREYMSSINNEVAYVVGSRSCPFSCTFCFHPSGRKYRQRSLDNLFLEIDYLITAFGVRKLVVSDELFAQKRQRVEEFCTRMAKYPVQWALQLRVGDVDEKLLRHMSTSGCLCVSYGLESAADEVLTSMKKHTTVKQIERALKLTYDAQLEIQGGFIFGDTAETEETAARTLEWNAQHHEYALDLNMIQVFPGTELYRVAVQRGTIKSEVEFLKEGCPQVNVSRMTDDQFRALASKLYEMNMRPKNAPQEFSIKGCRPDGLCEMEIHCNRCAAIWCCDADGIHMVMTRCPTCRQRYYVDPFAKLELPRDVFADCLGAGEPTALWGAGEVCIKLLDHYDALHANNVVVVDMSKSRQGSTIVRKPILPPSTINERAISKVIVAVVARKSEVLAELQLMPTVRQVWIPGVVWMPSGGRFLLRRVGI